MFAPRKCFQLIFVRLYPFALLCLAQHLLRIEGSRGHAGHDKRDDPKESGAGYEETECDLHAITPGRHAHEGMAGGDSEILEVIGTRLECPDAVCDGG